MGETQLMHDSRSMSAALGRTSEELKSSGVSAPNRSEARRLRGRAPRGQRYVRKETGQHIELELMAYASPVLRCSFEKRLNKARNYKARAPR